MVAKHRGKPRVKPAAVATGRDRLQGMRLRRPATRPRRSPAVPLRSRGRAIAVAAGLLLVACRPTAIAPRGGDEAPAAADASPASGTLEAAIARHLADAGFGPPAADDDFALLRRASLDLLGRIPTAAELDAYRGADPRTRYDAAIDRMLADPEYAAFLASTWTDVLLAQALKDRPAIEQGTAAWLTTAFASDRGFDDVTREILVAQGEFTAEGPAGFLASFGRKGRTAALAGETARIFLGTQIQCAQCHDHPDAAYTQREFHAFAAHFARTQVRPVKGDDGLAVRVSERARGQGRLPRPEDPPDEPTGEIVLPRYFGTPTTAGDHRREALATAILGDRRFARAIANRTWAQLLGAGVIEPVDALPVDGAVPPLLDALADSFIAGNHRLDTLIGAIVRSSAYRAAGRGDGDGAARVAAFAQARVRPLPSTALLGSLGVAAGLAAGERPQGLPGARAALREFRFAFDDDEGAAADQGPSLPQALLLQHGVLDEAAARPRGDTVLAHVLREYDDTDARIEALWWRLFTHAPDDEERALARSAVERGGPEAWSDLVHAMLVSSEFTTNH